MRVSAAHQDELFRFLVLPQLDQFFGNRIRRLVPADRHETGVLVAAFLGVGALHRHFEPVGIIDLLQDHMAAGTEVAHPGFGVGVAPDADAPAVENVDLGRTPGGATLAGCAHPAAAVAFAAGIWNRRQGLQGRPGAGGADGGRAGGDSGSFQYISPCCFHESKHLLLC